MYKNYSFEGVLCSVNTDFRLHMCIYVSLYIIYRHIPYFYIYEEEDRAPKKVVLEFSQGRREFISLSAILNARLGFPG